MTYTFEICRDRSGQYRIRFVAPHGQTVFTSQLIAERGAAESVVKAIQLHAPDAEMIDLTAAGAPRRYARRAAGEGRTAA